MGWFDKIVDVAASPLSLVAGPIGIMGYGVANSLQTLRQGPNADFSGYAAIAAALQKQTEIQERLAGEATKRFEEEKERLRQEQLTVEAINTRRTQRTSQRQKSLQSSGRAGTIATSALGLSTTGSVIGSDIGGTIVASLGGI